MILRQRGDLTFVVCFMNEGGKWKMCVFCENANHMIFHKWFVYTINIHFSNPTKKLLNFSLFSIIFWGEPLMKPSEQSATLCRWTMTFEWMHRNIENLFRSAINNESVSRFSPRLCQKFKSGYQDIPSSAIAPVSLFFCLFNSFCHGDLGHGGSKCEPRGELYRHRHRQIDISVCSTILEISLHSSTSAIWLHFVPERFILSFACLAFRLPSSWFRVQVHRQRIVECAFPSERIKVDAGKIAELGLIT